MNEVPRVQTPMEVHDAANKLVAALRAAGIEPNRNEAYLLLAQIWTETASGSACYGNNPGNISASASYQGNIYRPFWYTVDDSSSQRMKDLHQAMLEGKAPSAFRAYDTLDQGMTDYVSELKKDFPSLLKAAQTGDPALFAAAIKTSGYAPDAQPGTDVTLRTFMQQFAQKGLLSDLPLVSPGGGSGSPSSPLPSPSGPPFQGAVRADLPTLSMARGSYGSVVSLWQSAMKVHVTGVFDIITDAATRVFQHQQGLTTDGIVGPLTWGAWVSQ